MTTRKPIMSQYIKSKIYNIIILVFKDNWKLLVLKRYLKKVMDKIHLIYEFLLYTVNFICRYFILISYLIKIDENNNIDTVDEQYFIIKNKLAGRRSC